MLDEKLWQRWLADTQKMDNENWLGFDEYKQKLINQAQLQNRTKEERKIDFEEAKMVAEMALKKCNPKNDIGKLSQKKGGK